MTVLVFCERCPEPFEVKLDGSEFVPYDLMSRHILKVHREQMHREDVREAR